MKKLILVYLVTFSVKLCYSQKQAQVWYFGNGIGLDFKTTPPTPLYNNQAAASEGCATIADNNGRLLFYTNGQKIISRKGVEMKNGAGLLGDISSTDNTVIIPMPGNDSIYYVFTIGAAFQQNRGLRYSIINIKQDGGYGEVTEKNSLLESNTFEKLAAVRHCNKKDVWIVVRRWNSGEYLAFKLSAAGIDVNPVISNTGFVVTGDQSNAIGSLKFSSDGKLLAAAHSYENNIVELLKFDNSTGIISNPVFIKPEGVFTGTQNFTGVYGVEFSPNGTLLYISDNLSSDDPGKLYQYNITSHDSVLISNTKQTIASASAGTIGTLQLGPDNKIYVVVPGIPFLSAINNPDIYGAGCNYIENSILFNLNNGGALQLGLPRFLQSYFNASSNPYDFTRTGNCTSANVQFLINRVNNIDSVTWSFGDGGSSKQLSPVFHQYAAPGSYTVSLIVYKTDCSGLNDTITKTIWVADNYPLLGKDTGACDFNNFEIALILPDALPLKNYLWNTGSTAKTTSVSGPGKYWVEVEQQGCVMSDTINVAVLPKPAIKASEDTVVCATTGVVLSTVNTNVSSWLWSTGEVTPSIKIFKPGIYTVVASGNNCFASDTVQVFWGDCPFFIPNAFSPNDDGINDRFGVLNTFSLQNFSLKLYDRYGHIVFSTQNVTEKWDGKLNGKKMPSGTYTWQIVYINGLGYTKWLKGSVLLIH